MEVECDNCVVEGKESKAAVTLADGMNLCVDCCEELREMFEE